MIRVHSVKLQSRNGNFRNNAATLARSRRFVCNAYAGPGEPLELPGGAFWWIGEEGKQRLRSDLIYGQNFVISRTKVGGEGLVHQPKTPPPQRYQQQRPHRSAPRLITSGVVVIDTEFEVVEEPVQPNNECVGIVPFGDSAIGLAQSDDEADDVFMVYDSKNGNPRRTQRVKFKCNLCDTTQVKAVNPMAWKKGSVFARCDGCQAVHKLIDNLNIFEEMTEDGVFPPRNLRANFFLKETLDRIGKSERPNIDVKKIVNPPPTNGTDILSN